MIPAVAYIRVSTEKQDPENQRAKIEQWAAARGIYIVKWYVEAGVSGSVAPWKRLTFRRLIYDVKHGKLEPKPQLLITYETSRLVRTFTDLYRLLEIVEKDLGLVVVSISEKEQVLQNLDGVYRQFIRAVLAFVAHMEREFIRQRTKAALERLKKEGKISNVAERYPELVDAVAEYYRQSGSLRETARAFELSEYAVRRLLVAAGVYKPPRGTCPRCFSKMKLVSRDYQLVGGGIVLRTRWACPNCGYEHVEEESLNRPQ